MKRLPPSVYDGGVIGMPMHDGSIETSVPSIDAGSQSDRPATLDARVDVRPTADSSGPTDRPPDRPPSDVMLVDAAPVSPVVDAKPDAVVPVFDVAADAPLPASRCGTERPNLSTIVGADGLIIDADGTIYYSHVIHDWEVVGRVRPGGLPIEPEFATIVEGTTPWGLAIDSERRRLYVASANSSTIFVLDLKEPRPTPQILFTAPLIRPNDMAVGPKGDLYYSDQFDSRIYRIDLAGVRTVVTLSPVIDEDFGGTKASALAFASNGDLLVGARGLGSIYRIVLEGGAEVRRQPYGGFVGWVNGLAFDQRGRLYVGMFDTLDWSDLVRVETDGFSGEVMASDGKFSSMAFGRGALQCNDLYVADISGGIRRLTLDAVGLPMP